MSTKPGYYIVINKRLNFYAGPMRGDPTVDWCLRISEEVHSLSHRRFIMICFIWVEEVFSTIFSFPGPQSSFIPACKISLGGPGHLRYQLSLL